MSERASLFSVAPSGLTHLEEMQNFAEEMNPDIGPMFGRDVVRLIDELTRYRTALRLIRDDRCPCGGRFKWTGSQTRCEQCDRHQSYGYGYARDIAQEALSVG